MWAEQDGGRHVFQPRADRVLCTSVCAQLSRVPVLTWLCVTVSLHTGTCTSASPRASTWSGGGGTCPSVRTLVLPQGAVGVWAAHPPPDALQALPALCQHKARLSCPCCHPPLQASRLCCHWAQGHWAQGRPSTSGLVCLCWWHG